MTQGECWLGDESQGLYGMMDDGFGFPQFWRPKSELPCTQVCVQSWAIGTSAEAVFSCHRSESCK